MELFLLGGWLFIQAEKLACVDSSSGWRFETLMGALLLVPSWVGCIGVITPPLLAFGKAFPFYFLHFLSPSLSF